MLHSISKKISFFLLSQGCFKEQNLDVYVYGVELVISSLIGLLIILAVSLVSGELLNGVLFYLAFVSLRKKTGGLHCKTYFRCNALFITVFITCLLLCKLLALTPYKYLFLSIMTIISFVIILIFAPVENQNKPLDTMSKKKHKALSLIISFIHILVFVVLSFLKINAQMIIITDFIVAISMLSVLHNNIYTEVSKNEID